MSTISAGTTSTTTLIHSGDTTGSLVLKTNDTGSGGTTAVTIDTSQNVGIGTTNTTDQRLKVKQSADTGASSFSFKVEANANDTGLYIGYRGAGAATAADTCAITATYGSTGAFKPITFLTSDAERMRIDSSGRVLVGLTSANTSGSNFQVSQGVTFPATQSASSDVNTLDDYEEGTWTPVITGTSTAGTATYTTQSGTYVKIGKYVFLQMFVVFSSAHTGTGGTKVGGFPFTIGADFGGGGTITYKTAWVTNGPDFMQAEANTTFGYLRYDTNTAQADIAPNVNIQNTTGFMLSIWYLASA